MHARADVRIQDKDGQTPLSQAILLDDLDCVKALVKQSYCSVPSEISHAARTKVFRLLGVFVGLRKQHAELENFSDRTLLYELFS